MAFLVYSLFVWTGLSHVLQPYSHAAVAGIGKLRGMTHATKLLVFLTVIMGGFVAGLDAGLLYNSWPKYADRWIPENMASRVPAWRNLFENEVTVQFMHRNLAYLTLTSITATWLVARRMRLSPRAKVALHTLLALGYCQALLGITTLINYVPVWLGSIHQNGSMALLTSALWLSNEIRRVPK